MSAVSSAVPSRIAVRFPVASRAVSTPLRRALLVTAGWRVAIGVWGVIAHGLVRKGPYASDTLMHRGWTSNPFTYLIDAGVRMDGFWYARIAAHGYTYSATHLSSIAYFPLFPILIKAVAVIVGNVYIAGMLIPTLSLFLAIWALQHWLDGRGAGSATALAAGLMLCFPVGFFWAAMYTESLFLALALASFVLFERDRFLLSSAAVLMAVLCRPTGLILVPCLAIMAVQRLARDGFRIGTWALPITWARHLAWPSAVEPQRPALSDVAGIAGAPDHAGLTDTVSSGGRSSGYAAFPTKTLHSTNLYHRWQLFLPMIAGPIGYVGFAVYQWLAFGTPLASVRAEQVPPFSRNLAEGLSDLMLRRPGFPAWYLAVLLLFGLLFLAAVPLVYRRFGLPYAVFAAMAVILPMSTGLVSLERYIMIDFPIFAAVALVRSRLIPTTLMVIGFYMSLGLMALFIGGYTVI